MLFDLFFGQKREQKQNEKRRLIQLKDVITEFKEMPLDKNDGFEYVVMFFNVISRFEDKGKVEFARNADEINCLINQMGRQGYGWNRTTKGEMVTYDNFYVGDRYGLFTKTLRYWMQSNSIYKDFFKRWHPEVAQKVTSNPFDWQVVLFYIIEPFIIEKKKALLNALDKGIASL